MKAWITALSITTLAASAGLWHYKTLYEEATRDVPTREQHRKYSTACTNWINDQINDDYKERLKFVSARSWLKYRQFVVEIVPSEDTKEDILDQYMTDETSPVTLCTVDLQTGVMWHIMGADREKWMFY